MKTPDLRHISTERMSQSVLYILTALIAIVFALFYLVGYKHPFEENPDFNAPLFTGTLIVFQAVLVIIAIVVTVAAALRCLRRSNREDRTVNGIPAARIATIIAVATLLTAVVTFVAGSARPMTINGNTYTDTFWLKTADMFVFTSLLLIIAAIGAVVFGATRYLRPGKKGPHKPSQPSC